mgnify:CR=1 FL=1
MNKTFWALALILIFFIQCSNKSNSSEYPVVHFDIKGLIQNQISKLEQNDSQLQKNLKFNDRESKVHSDSIEWEKEFRIFRALDINKPALVPLYDSSITENQTKYFPNRDSRKASVRELVINKYPSGKIKSLKGKILEDNYLYNSESDVFIRFTETPNLIDTYSINVSTKVIFRDQEISLIEGKIIN